MIIDAFRALEAGKELANAATWKNVQLWTNNVTVLLGAAVSLAAAFGYPIPLTGEQIATLVSGLSVLVGVFNAYATVATTTRLGLSPRSGGDDPGIPDGSGRGQVQRGPAEWLLDLDDRAAGGMRDMSDRNS